MTYMFDSLNNFIKTIDSKEKLTVSEVIKRMNLGEKVIVGGKIKNITPYLEDFPVYAVLDDEIGETNLCIFPQVFEELKDRFKIGNTIIAKGEIREHKFEKKHPENSGAVYKYVVCSAVRVISEA